MPLTDPELDLLQEMLEEDPASDIFLQVGEELVRRGRWGDAVDVLAAGLARSDDDGPTVGYALLARAALECGAFSVALEAIGALEIDPESQPELSRIEILALERSGRIEEAHARVERFLAHDPSDVVVTSVLERLCAPPPSRRTRSLDPFYTVERAEAYVDVGRTDRALRVYRRILQANREDPSIELRMRQLLTAPQRVPDDLSVELTDPGLVPEAPDLFETPAPSPLTMPPPGLMAGGPRSGPGLDDDPDELTATPVAASREVRPRPGPTFSNADPDDEKTEHLDLVATLKRYADPTPDDAPQASPRSVPPIDRRPQPPQRLGDPEDDLPTVKAQATEPAPADLDLLRGTETEWTTSGEDRPSRRLLRR